MGYAAPRRSPTAFGAVTLAHAALLSALLTPTMPPLLGEGSPGPGRTGGDFRSDVALIEIEPEALRVTAPPVITVPTHVAVQEVAMPTLELGELDRSPEEKLRGLYLGQVRARIERAWEGVTESAPAGNAVECEVRVTQDARGGVLEVGFGDCQVDSTERATLVRIIRGASPLPAPPSDLPFSRQVALSLHLPK